MMSKKSRTKGAAFEREVCKLIKDEFGLDVRRNLEQYQVKDMGDIMLDPFLIECKRYASAGANWFRPDWWEQVKRSSQNEYIPVLIYKYDRQDIRVVLPVVAFNADFDTESHGFTFNDNALRPVVTDWETGAMIMREWMDCDDLA